MNIDIEDRKARFDQFREERMPVLVEFATDLGFSNPHEIILSPNKFLPGLDQWLSEQEITEDDKAWGATRFGYFIGEYFVENYNGYWLVCESKDSRYYGQYVIGGFSNVPNPNAIINPMEASWILVNEPVGRSLTSIIKEIEGSLSAA